jgi:hypothetical protein
MIRELRPCSLDFVTMNAWVYAAGESAVKKQAEIKNQIEVHKAIKLSNQLMIPSTNFLTRMTPIVFLNISKVTETKSPKKYEWKGS